MTCMVCSDKAFNDVIVYTSVFKKIIHLQKSFAQMKINLLANFARHNKFILF